MFLIQLKLDKYITASEDIKCSIYLNGNSLGLQPKSTLENITKV